MIRTRLAPTPSGFLHLGNCFNFLVINALAEKHTDSIIRLRIDDIDSSRTRSAYINFIFETLHSLGIKWHEGPKSADEVPAYSQHNRLGRYKEVTDQLVSRELIYRCACSRADLLQFELTQTTAYCCPCLQTEPPAQSEAAWRLRPEFYQLVLDRLNDPDQGLPNHQETGMPPVLIKRDGLPAYQLVSVVDDVDYQMTHIVRGEDLWASTILQQFIAQWAGLDNFGQIRFIHHPLLVMPDGQKLSKSAGSNATGKLASIADLKQLEPLVDAFTAKIQVF